MATNSKLQQATKRLKASMPNRYAELMQDIEELKQMADRVAGLTPNNRPMSIHSVGIRVREAKRLLDEALAIADNLSQSQNPGLK